MQAMVATVFLFKYAALSKVPNNNQKHVVGTYCIAFLQPTAL